MGTGLAQAVPIAVSPILTRIYSPSDMGLFAVYTTMATIIGAIANGRYELAVMLPKKRTESLALIKLGFIISLIISFLLLLVTVIFGKEIARLLGNEDIYLWLFLLPISTLLLSLYQNLSYWNIKSREFKHIAGSRIFQSTGTGLGQLGLGLVVPGGVGLVLGTFIGNLGANLSLLKLFNTKDWFILKGINKKRIKQIGKRFRKFPEIDVPATALNLGATHVPNILFASLFSSIYSGFYYLTLRVLQAPITLISSSVLDVFKEEAAKDYREKGNAKNIYLKTLKILFLIAIVPSVLLYFFIEDIFGFVFGKDWIIAGEYAKILIPALFLRFMSNPLSFMIYIAEKQLCNLIVMIILFVAVVITFFISSNHYEVVYKISIIQSGYYIFHLILSAKLAKVF
ncbi:hypothetical protein AO058_00380 [Salegentibacter sp. T436]|nr:hypothetical protein AO058_00380 [Salegentibacter sp. T436]